MKGQPARLAADTAGPFAGSAIDRRGPLQFRLDGRTINGFVGDTLLSAVFAAGIDTLGRRQDGPVALTARSAPAIIAASLANDRQRALAMDRTMATDGADYLTLRPGPWRGGFTRLRRMLHPAGTLGLDLEHNGAPPLPWLANVGAAEAPADLLVVGGGVAGLSAAVSGAQAGLSVILVEASPRLGGCAGLFGTLEGEETAEASLARLTAAIAAADGITVLTHALAFAARPGVVRVHVTDRAQSMPSARVIDLHARHIVLATGTTERLPLFAGNRLPGTIGVRDAYDLAQHYGVWSGQSALFATTSSAAYRLAMLTRDAGVNVPRIVDARQQPQSRFIEFSKAYGITLAAGTNIAHARRSPQGRELLVTPQLAVEGFNRTEPGLTVDRLVHCGGWQPDLDLWHMAGGRSQWNRQAQRLEPIMSLPGLALAGNAAGYYGHSACLASGPAAIDHLLGRSGDAVKELAVDAIYETPDGPCPAAPVDAAAKEPCFLDGSNFAVRPAANGSRWPAWLKPGSTKPAWSLAAMPHALNVAEIAAGVQLGLIPAESAGLVAQERVGMVALPAHLTPSQDAPASAPLVPSFLNGRFGPDAQLWQIRPTEPRKLEVGALIHANSDSLDPAAAIGVVLGDAEGGSLALLAARHGNAQDNVVVREHGRATTVVLVAPHPQEDG